MTTVDLSWKLRAQKAESLNAELLQALEKCAEWINFMIDSEDAESLWAEAEAVIQKAREATKD